MRGAGALNACVKLATPLAPLAPVAVKVKAPPAAGTKPPGSDSATYAPGADGTAVSVPMMHLTEELAYAKGAGWQAVMEVFFEQFNSYMPRYPRDRIQFAQNVTEAVEMLAAH